MSIKYTRKFIVDKSIAKGIKWLNKNGFNTLGCCSGLEGEHDNSRERMYIKFEPLPHTKEYLIKIYAREVGFRILNHKEILRIETEKPNKLMMFNVFICRLKENKDSFSCRAMGISNWCRDIENRKLYSVQFYDYDINETVISTEHLAIISEIFPYDCIMYSTKHGIHFLSFSLLKGLRYTKTKAIETSKLFGDQDFWTEAKDLTLRVSPKWKLDKKKMRVIMSEKPEFKGLIKEPNNYIISEKHLEFYYKYMGLPKWVYDKYEGCDKRNYEIKISHYKTRD